jgi:hypothetical protein
MRKIATRSLVCTIVGLIAFVTGAKAQQTEKEQERGRIEEGGRIDLKAFAIEAQPSERNAWETRDELNGILNQWYPRSMRQVLQLDPSLLKNPLYLQSYPRLAEFLNEHPEVANNPTYFLGGPSSDVHIRMAPVAAIAGILALAGVVVWLIRLIVDYRRWLRVSKLQTEAQAKILDRFTSNEDLLGFIQTPAGRRFMESSALPIAPQSVGAPFGRILWSVQIGLVLLFGGVGMVLLQGTGASLNEDVNQALLIIGSLGVAAGIGFVFSGLASYLLSRRFGLLNPTDLDTTTGSKPAQTSSS